MIIDEERPRDLSYPPPVSAPAPMSSKRREALGLGLGASLPPAATVTPLAPRKGRAYNGPTNRAYEHRPSPPSLSSPPYSTVTLQSSSQSTTSSTLYPPSHSYSPRPAQAPLHSVAEPTLGAITPNPLLFRNDVVLPDARSPPPSRPGGVTPNLLLLPNSEFAKSQPPGMIGNMYPTTAPPVVQAPQPMRCPEEKHDFGTHYGVGGIIISVICFPVGLAALFFDQDKRCRRCGLRTDRHGHVRPS